MIADSLHSTILFTHHLKHEMEIWEQCQAHRMTPGFVTDSILSHDHDK